MILDDLRPRTAKRVRTSRPHRGVFRDNPNIRRHGIIYGIPIHDPATLQVRVDYVGQTVQPLQDREAQHRACQPWSDLIAGPAFVIERGWWTQAELDAREAFQMRRVRPRYPYEYNLDNPDRIPIYEARRQRLERDRACGVPSPTWGRPRDRVVRRSWSPRQVKAAVLVVLWLVLAVGVWLATGDPGVHGAAAGFGVASGVYVAAWRSRRPRRRRRPARRSRPRRR